jgi:lysylphosphatidylglycerol synthetase-like protein (DUF2156 family)
MLKKTSKMADNSLEEECVSPYQLEAELIRAYGSHPLAFFGLASENEHFLAPEAAGLVNYRLVGKVAIVLGDPVCAPEAAEQVIWSFLKFCALHRWSVAFYQARPDYLDIYRGLKLRTFKLGEEALLLSQAFTLNGSALANVRTSCRRAEREGIRIQWYEGVPPEDVLHQFQHVSRAWLESKGIEQGSETGFSTGKLNDLPISAQRADRLAILPTVSASLHPAVPRLVSGVATTSAGTACAFVTFSPIYGMVSNEMAVMGKSPEDQGWGWALDLMRRTPDAPPGVMELLLVQALERFRTSGAHVVSLGLAAWADSKQEITPAQRRFANFVTDGLGLLESHRTLFSFKQKFHPCWKSRYLVTNASLTLPKIALAVLRVRNYSGGRVARLLEKLI